MFKIMTALITPFTKKGDIDYESLGRIIDDQMEQGCQGFIVCGTTAEAPTLTEEEKFAILSFVITKTKRSIPLWFGCGTNDTKETIRLCLKAQEYDIDGLLIVTPYYNKPSQEGLFRHYKAISDAVTKDVMVYNVPSRTGVEITYETLRRLLLNCEHIKALKHASHAFDMVSQLHKEFPEFQMYSGEDGSFEEGKQAGMCGLISVMSHYNMKELIAYEQHPQEDLLEHLYLDAYYTFMEASPAPIKYMLEKKGLCENILRLPLCVINDETKKRLDEYMS